MAKLEDLKELAKGIDRNKVKNIHIIGNKLSNRTTFDEFYEALLDDKFETDDEYAHYFYSTDSNNKAYYKLKDRLFERLINTIFFIDTNKKNRLPIQKTYYECYKNAVAVKLMLGKSIRIPAIRLAEKILKKSTHFGFTDISLELCRTLKLHYATFDINKKEYIKNSSLIRLLIKTYKAEINAESFLQEICFHHDKQVILHEDMASIFHKYFKKLSRLNQKYESYKLIMYSYIYYFLYLELKGDWENLFVKCDELLKKLETKPQFSSSNLFGFAYSRKVLSQFMLRNFEECENCMPKCFANFEAGSFNWFFVQNLNLRIQFHTRNFKKAEQISVEIKKYKSSNIYYENWIESWRIYDAFIYYLNILGKLDLNTRNLEKFQAFRLNKFLNEVPKHSKDKKGSNITILILQVLFLLEYKKYNELIDRSESLKIYSQRYLKGEGTYRSNCFIKMLLCLPNGDFESSKVQEKAKKYLNRLHSNPIQKAKQSAELEVIPYETLWEFVLESLDRHKK